MRTLADLIRDGILVPVSDGTYQYVEPVYVPDFAAHDALMRVTREAVERLVTSESP